MFKKLVNQMSDRSFKVGDKVRIKAGYANWCEAHYPDYASLIKDGDTGIVEFDYPERGKAQIYVRYPSPDVGGCSGVLDYLWLERIE